MQKPDNNEEQEAFFEFFDTLKIDPVTQKVYPEQDEPDEDDRTSLSDAVDEMIIDAIKTALIEHNHNRTKAAKCLGISRENLIYRLKTLKIF